MEETIENLLGQVSEDLKFDIKVDFGTKEERIERMKKTLIEFSKLL